MGSQREARSTTNSLKQRPSGQSYPNRGRSYPNSAESYPNRAESYPNSAESYPNTQFWLHFQQFCITFRSHLEGAGGRGEAFWISATVPLAPLAWRTPLGTVASHLHLRCDIRAQLLSRNFHKYKNICSVTS